MLVHVLVAIDPPSERRRLGRLLERPDLLISTAPGRINLLERLSGESFDLLVVGQRALGDNGEHLIRSIRSLPEHPELVVLVEQEDAEETAGLLALGCLGVLNQGLGDRAMRSALTALFERHRGNAITRLRAERPEEQYSLNDFVSESPTMQVFVDLARRVVTSESSLLILGETGVGKERLARAIHAEGARSAGPFMALNCGALPETLLESELFGHEEGAFTGATRSRKGYFELAHRGTIFLDEIGEMPLHLQVKLLRVLDQHRIQRVGAEKPIDVDVRVMAATNRDLEADVAQGRFRSDLYYRLAVVTLEIPPLRERREDIRPLAESYLAHFNAQTGRTLTGLEPPALKAMERYPWPGNVRELINALERAVLLAGGERIGPQDLPLRVRAEEDGSGAGEPLDWRFRDLPPRLLERSLAEARKEIVSAFERRYLAGLLSTTKGRIGEAAGRAAINERTLYDLMRRHGLKKEDFKPGTRVSDGLPGEPRR
jgi:DNA-binding NtrC family response regulator